MMIININEVAAASRPSDCGTGWLLTPGTAHCPCGHVLEGTSPRERWEGTQDPPGGAGMGSNGDGASGKALMQQKLTPCSFCVIPSGVPSNPLYTDS